MPTSDSSHIPRITGAVTFLFTDIEGSTALWERDSARMSLALAAHDSIARRAIESRGGVVVKMTGDGVYAAFDDAYEAVAATLDLQQTLVDPKATNGVELHVRCGLHAGAVESRDHDYFGSVVNRAARLMSAAHGGQVLLSQTVVDALHHTLPDGVTLRDLGTVRLKDLSAPEHVYQVLHPRLRQEYPALRSLQATPNNLPQQPTNFIGRTRELNELLRLLSTSRLLTLTGAGGCGKTRLCLQVAAESLDLFPDGVWFVELAPLSERALVPLAVATVLGLKEASGAPIDRVITDYLSDKRLLILLDNCEHLIDICAQLADSIIRSSSHITIIASSREALGISGEQAYRVPSLSLPDSTREFTPASIAVSESGQLFDDRARLASPVFQITPKNVAALASICNHLDGIPLAIELAAAQVRFMSLEEINLNLDRRFQLLTRGSRTALPRQQTLESLIGWSYDLLKDREKQLLLQLSVFAGGWTLDAAERVCSNGVGSGGRVLEDLTSLCSKSLVVTEPGDDFYRYRLLETVREYALQRLVQTGDAHALKTRHLTYYAGIVERADAGLVSAEQAIWYGQLDQERDNLLAAHAWCSRAENGAELGLRLAHSLKLYWVNCGLLSVGHRLLVDALSHPDAQIRNLERCQGLFDAGQLDCWMGRYAEAQEFLNESLAIARELGHRPRIAAVLQPLGLAALGLGDTSAALGHLQEALAMAQELGRKREVMGALNALAQLHRFQGASDVAAPLYEDVVLFARELGDRESIAIGLLNLAMVSIEREVSERARDLLLEVHAIAAEIGSKLLGQCTFDVCTGLSVLERNWGHAARFFGAAEAQAEITEVRRDPADAAFLLPRVAQARAALGADAFASAERDGRALGYTEAMLAVRLWLVQRP